MNYELRTVKTNPIKANQIANKITGNRKKRLYNGVFNANRRRLIMCENCGCGDANTDGDYI